MSKKRKGRNYIAVVLCILRTLLVASLFYAFLLFQQYSAISLFPLFRFHFLTDVGYHDEKRTLTIFTTVLKADVISIELLHWQDDPLRRLAQENCIKLLSDLDSTYVIVFTNDIEWIRFSKSVGVFAVSNIK